MDRNWTERMARTNQATVKRDSMNKKTWLAGRVVDVYVWRWKVNSVSWISILCVYKSSRNILCFQEDDNPHVGGFLLLAHLSNNNDGATLCILNQSSTVKQASMWQKKSSRYMEAQRRPAKGFHVYFIHPWALYYWCTAVWCSWTLLEELRFLRVTHNWIV